MNPRGAAASAAFGAGRRGRHDAVPPHVVVEGHVREADEVAHGDGGVVVRQLHHDLPVVGADVGFGVDPLGTLDGGLLVRHRGRAARITRAPQYEGHQEEEYTYGEETALTRVHGCTLPARC